MTGKKAQFGRFAGTIGRFSCKNFEPIKISFGNSGPLFFLIVFSFDHQIVDFFFSVFQKRGQLFSEHRAVVKFFHVIGELVDILSRLSARHINAAGRGFAKTREFAPCIDGLQYRDCALQPGTPVVNIIIGIKRVARGGIDGAQDRGARHFGIACGFGLLSACIGGTQDGEFGDQIGVVAGCKLDGGSECDHTMLRLGLGSNGRGGAESCGKEVQYASTHQTYFFPVGLASSSARRFFILPIRPETPFFAMTSSN